jgi:hypothetical protein
VGRRPGDDEQQRSQCRKSSCELDICGRDDGAELNAIATSLIASCQRAPNARSIASARWGRDAWHH